MESSNDKTATKADDNVPRTSNTQVFGDSSDLKDTQIIADTLNLNSQTAHTARLRVLADYEENLIVDSSEKEHSLDTQQLIDKEVEINSTTTQVINDKDVTNNIEMRVTSSSDKEIDDANFNDTEVIESLPVHKESESSPLNFKFASPWLNNNSNNTPWLNKVTNPFSETPTKITIKNPFDETPIKSNLSNSLGLGELGETPTTKAHYIFNEMRMNQELPELEVDSLNNFTVETQMLETQGDEAFSLPLKESHHLNVTLSNHEDNNDVSDIVIANENDMNKTDNDLDITDVNNQSNVEDHEFETTNEDTNVDQDTHNDDNSNVNITNDTNMNIEMDIDIDITNPNEDIHLTNRNDADADLQVPGTAPESTQQILSNSSQFDKSVVISDDERGDFDKSASSNKLIIEDSIAIYHQHKREEQEKEQDFEENLIDGISKDYKDEENEDVPLQEEVMITQKNEDITQEISDVDGEDEEIDESKSKIDNTFDEERHQSTPIKRSRRPRQAKNKRIRYEESSDEEEVRDNPILNEEILRTNNENEHKPNQKIPINEDISSSIKEKSLALDEEEQLLLDDLNGSDNEELFSQDQLNQLSTAIKPNKEESNESGGIEELTIEPLKYEIISQTSVFVLYDKLLFPGRITNHSSKGYNITFNYKKDIVTTMYPLDLRIGDIVKLNSAIYKIYKFSNYKPNDNTVIRDCRGFDTVYTNRVNKSTGKLGKEEIIPISDVLVDYREWIKRERVQLPKLTRDKSIISDDFIDLKAQNGKLFSGCLFVITGLNDDEIENSILSNGGTVKNGFGSLFDTLKDNTIIPKETLKNFTFAAVITSEYSRSMKYLETLSLGWPLLSYKFIDDSIEREKLVDIPTYLLPSGLSKHLNTIKSSNVSNFINNYNLNKSLNLQISNNLIMSNCHVLIIAKDFKSPNFIISTLGSKLSQFMLTNQSNLITKLSTIEEERVLLYHNNLKTLKSLLNNLKKKRDKPSQIKLEIELIDWEWLVQCLIDGFAWNGEKYNVN